jgi:hypothetical protein
LKNGTRSSAHFILFATKKVSEKCPLKSFKRQK